MYDKEHVASALREAEARFLHLPNVRAIDYGIPRHDGVLRPEERAIRIHVHRRLGKDDVKAAAKHRLTELFPESIQGIPIDVLELGPVRPQRSVVVERLGRSTTTGRVSDPLEGGVGVGPLTVWRAGTMGAVVVDRVSHAPMALSNHHVLWGSTGGRAQRIIQPSRLEGGSIGNVIGENSRHALTRSLDAAVAVLTGRRAISVSQRGLGSLRGLAVPELGSRVRKSGLASGLTSGIVTGTNLVQEVRTLGVVRRFRDVVFIEPEQSWQEVSRAGDSGALWVNAQMEAVALHFAGTNRPSEKAFGLDLTAVLRALGVALLVERT